MEKRSSATKVKSGIRTSYDGWRMLALAVIQQAVTDTTYNSRYIAKRDRRDASAFLAGGSWYDTLKELATVKK
ncbi:MAG: hypothetical protein K6G80_10060 [Treponema sp.]|nr:hypothetical protein [Treponema sp.]